jgi:hypothetical protein
MKRVVLLLSVLVGSATVAGCRSDFDRCEDVCRSSDDCTDTYDIDDCIDECTRDVDRADDGCTTSFEAFADCTATKELDCPDTIDSCDSEIEDFFDDCDEDFRFFEYADPFLPAVDDNPMPL